MASLLPQVQIRFVTKQAEYAVSDAPLAIASTVTVEELNSLLNELIRENRQLENNVEFEFLINGEILRVPLNQHLEHREISSEVVVEVEYIERLPAPEPEDCLVHDDWVAAVQVAPSGSYILSGCYDNSLHVWTRKGEQVTSLSGHKGAVKAVAWVTQENNRGVFLSGSIDQTAMLWKWNADRGSAECVSVYKGHERSIETLAVSPTKVCFATGGFDKMLKVWNIEDEERNIDGQSRAKKSKISDSQTKTPYMTLKGHRECISCVKWVDESTLLTSSWDHTIKLWDSEPGGIKQEIAGEKAIFHVDHNPSTGTLLAGSADRHVRLYDPRSTEGSVVKTMFSSHTQWISSVQWSTRTDHLFLSGSYDNLLKLWDTRCPKAPLFDLGGHQDKVLCCDWSWEDTMVSGGADNAVRIFKTKHALNNT